MGINENTKNLIDALAKNDTAKAKAYAQCIIANDSSEKNRRWREKTSVLLKTGDEKSLELPAELYSICELVKPGKDFAAERYYLPEAEAPVVEEIIRKQEIVQRMQVLGIPTVNTTLLYGEPGTGKTELAKYIAYKLEKPILLLRFSNLIDSYMGVTGKNIGKVFDFFRQHDVILFLDEIDTVAAKRDGGKGCDGEISRTTACIMQELDRLSGGGIIIAATNRKDLLDEALLRRFSLHHEVKRVGEEERLKMVNAFWDSLDIVPPFDMADYARNDYTPSRIHTDMVAELALYLEGHPEPTDKELEVRNTIIIPDSWKEIFLASAEALMMPDKPSAEMEKESFRIAAIAPKVPIPEEDMIRYGQEAKLCYDKREDAIRYSIHLCRKAYQEYFHTDKAVTMGELAEWVQKEVGEKKAKKPKKTTKKKSVGSDTYTIYTDGGCMFNPGGPGGYGCVIINDKTGESIELSNGYKRTTNNRMEIMAAIKALEYVIPLGAKKVTLHSDSQYLVYTMYRGWQKKKNLDLWDRLEKLNSQAEVEYKWVRGHSGNQYNEVCERLASDAYTERATKTDTGYLHS